MSNSARFNELAEQVWSDEELMFEAKAQDVAMGLATVVYRSGLNRAQLAEKLGWKPSRVSRILTGNTNVTIKTIFQICRAINLDFDLVLRNAQEESVVVDASAHQAMVAQTKRCCDG